MTKSYLKEGNERKVFISYAMLKSPPRHSMNIKSYFSLHEAVTDRSKLWKKDCDYLISRRGLIDILLSGKSYLKVLKARRVKRIKLKISLPLQADYLVLGRTSGLSFNSNYEEFYTLKEGLSYACWKKENKLY